MTTRFRTAIVFAVAGAVLLLGAGCCPERGLRRQAIAPSVNAVTAEFDDLVDDAVERGAMDPVEGDTWKSESALLRSLVAPPAPAGSESAREPAAPTDAAQSE